MRLFTRTRAEIAARRERFPTSPARRVSLVFVAIAVACTALGDFEVSTLDPWRELGRLGLGLITPTVTDAARLAEAVLYTVAFAVVGVLAAALCGFGLALVFHRLIVRTGCAFIRAVHELFWALLLMQMFGLSPLTGLLAIAIPYAGVFAKVYSEILEEADPAPLQAVPGGAGRVSTFLFARLPDAWVHMKSYSLYRLECGLRASAVLGFVGLPTLGFHLESSFSQREYSEAWAFLFVLYAIVATVRWWARPNLIPLLAVGSLFALPAGDSISLANVTRFLGEDIVPGPLRNGALDGATVAALGAWIGDLVTGQALEGIVNTVLLSQVALVGTGLLALVWFPLISRRFFGPFGRTSGHLFLVVMRSTPEYVLAYVLLQLWGPSMLPAVVALAIHNGGIIGHLIGRYADALPLRPDSPRRRLDLYGYEAVPRVYGQFLAFLFYRWEWIMRETAILGILGIHTVGFYVDSALAEFRFDEALALILITALMNIGIDATSRAIRARLRLTTTPGGVRADARALQSARGDG